MKFGLFGCALCTVLLIWALAGNLHSTVAARASVFAPMATTHIVPRGGCNSMPGC